MLSLQLIERVYISILGTGCLISRIWWDRLGPELQLRLLAALCNDITEGAILKAEIAQRAEQALALAAERQKQLAEVGACARRGMAVG